MEDMFRAGLTSGKRKKIEKRIAFSVLVWGCFANARNWREKNLLEIQKNRTKKRIGGFIIFSGETILEKFDGVAKNSGKVGHFRHDGIAPTEKIKKKERPCGRSFLGWKIDGRCPVTRDCF